MEIQDLNVRLAALSPAKRALLEEKLKQAALDKPSEVVSIPRRTERHSAPVSFAQQRLWFLNQLEAASSSYNESSAIRLRGPLHLKVLQAAINQLVARHEVLRTHLVTVDGEPRQLVRENAEIDLPTIDLRTIPADRLCDELQRTLLTNMQRPFDLSRELPLRFILVQTSAEEHVLLKVMHHIASDGWSTAIVWRELGTYYRDFLAGKTTRLPALPIQYQDYAAWQRTWLQGTVLQEQLAYWKKALDGLEPLQLPTDRQRSAGRKSPAGRVLLDVDDDLAASLKTFSRQHGVTFFMTLLAAFQALLQRYCGQDDIVVGSPIAGRTRPELEGLIGFFVNTLVLRLDLSNDPTFVQLLMQARDVAMGAYAHQELPFEKIVEELNPVRDLDTPPLFNVMFAHQSVPPANVEFAGLETSPVDVPGLEAKFDLFFAAVEREGRLLFRMDYAVDLFERATIERMLRNFQTLLRSIVEHPERRISALDLIAAAEKQKLLVEWNDTARDYPRDRCVHALFESQAQKTPDAVAVIFGEQQLSYRDLNKLSNRLAHYLRKQGVTSDTPVGICMERSVDLIVGVLAILKAGGAYLPLDPSYPLERLKFMLADSQASVLLTDDKLLEYGGSTEGSDTSIRRVCLDSQRDLIAREDEANPASETAASRIAYLIYTSGSTGQPKGVAIEHRNAAAFLSWVHTAFTKEELSGVLAATSICFDLSVFEIFAPLTCGGTVILAENALALATIPKTSIVSLVNTVPSAMTELLTLKAIPRSVRVINLAGEPLSPELVRRIYQSTSVRNVHDLYGPSECTTYSTWARRTADGPRTIGRPIANTQIYILDVYLNPVPIGVVGEIHIGGDGVGRGYLNQPALTAERFIQHSFDGEPARRLYKTGDLARYLPDGNIEFIGRRDNQVKIRGYRIELGEIESLMTQHPAVRACAVVIRSENHDGFDNRLIAYIVPQQVAPESRELRGFLRGMLPESMIPSAFVTLDTLPLTPNGKLDRKALPAPDRSRANSEERFIAPRTPVEKRVATIWADVLKLERVGMHDNFFHLGGHSLLAVQVISRINQSLGVKIPFRRLFEAATIASLVEEIDGQLGLEAAASAPPIMPLPRNGSCPLSFAQQRLWFLDRLSPGNATYNVPEAFGLSGELDAAALQKTLDEIVRRHEILRTIFRSVDGEPQQVVLPAARVSLNPIDMSAVPACAREDSVARILREEAGQPFDLSSGPLLRAVLLRLSRDEHILLLNMHHIVSDGWSMGVLFSELSVLYRAYRAGKPSPLPDLALQYADYSVWQRQWLRGKQLQRQLAYWREKLDGLVALQLPTDHPRPSLQSQSGASLAFELSEKTSAGIRELSQNQGVTPFMTLLAGLQLLLSRYSGQTDVAVGSPIAGRTCQEIEPLIGFFVNTLVLRCDLSGDVTFTELLRRVRRTTLDAYDHQDLPFEKLVEELHPSRSPAYSPFFQVMFAFQNSTDQPLELQGLRVQSIRIQSQTAKFDLTLTISEKEGRFRGSLNYNRDLFDDSTAERMIGHFQNLLQGIIENPERRLSEQPLLSAPERSQLLLQWNDTKTDYPGEKSIHQIFAEWVERTPDAVAWVGNGRKLSYRELDQRANQVARYLSKRAIGREALIGLYIERSLDMVVAMLGVLKAGAAYVPLDPDYPERRLEFMIQDSGVALILASERGKGQLPSAAVPIVGSRQEWDQIAAEEITDPEIRVAPDNLAYVMYTSGSTGEPKGVEVVHRGVVRLVCGNTYAQLNPEQVFLQIAPASFDASTFEIWGALLHGSRCVLYPSGVPTPQELGAFIEEHRVTTLWLTASFYNLLIDAAPQALRRIKQLLIGGEVLSLAHVRKGLESLPDTQIINGYGPTESTTFACCYPIPRQLPAGLRAIPIGRPIANTRVYILDRYRQPVPVGVIGELYIGGDGLARGYLNRRELTAERFISCSFDGVATQRLYKTGDRARYLPDGNIEFLGRSDDQVKIRGYRIELGEIEAVLSSHSEVQTAAVMMREDAPGNKQLAAYIVGHRGGSVASTELRNFLAQRLPAFMVPAVFITLDSLPLTANGKVDRQALPRPESVAFDRALYTEPRTPNEAMLAQLWAESLGVERVGLHDNFFDLGGHSLLVVKVCERVKKIAGREVPLATLFRAPTVAEFAQWLELTERPTGSVTLVPIQPDGDRPPIFCAHGAWGSIVFGAELSRQLGSGQPFYGLQAPGLEGEQEPLARIEEMAAHHVRELQRIQPEGPYYLAGLSMGGLVAFEIAQQLTAQGQKVALLGLIDTYCPLQRSALKTWRSRARRLFVDDFFGRVVFHGRNLMQLNTLKRSRYAREKTRSVGKRLVAKLRIDHQADKVHLADLYAVKVRKANLAASRSYRPQTYSGRITLFLTTDARTGKQDSSEAWRRLAAGGLDVRAVPGDHSTMLNESHVGVLAESLRCCLQQAQAAIADQLRRSEGSHVGE